MSELLVHKRQAKFSRQQHHFFRLYTHKNNLCFSLGPHQHEVELNEGNALWQHLLLKIILNTHSTLVMGKLNRYEGNLMTWVRPSNKKLIDRSLRYIDLLLERQGKVVDQHRMVESAHHPTAPPLELDLQVVEVVEGAAEALHAAAGALGDRGEPSDLRHQQMKDAVRLAKVDGAKDQRLGLLGSHKRLSAPIPATGRMPASRFSPHPQRPAEGPTRVVGRRRGEHTGKRTGLGESHRASGMN